MLRMARDMIEGDTGLDDVRSGFLCPSTAISIFNVEQNIPIQQPLYMAIHLTLIP